MVAGVIIAFRSVEVVSGPRVYQWIVAGIPPFEVGCEKYGTSRTDRSRHLTVFEAPTVEDLECHPAFRNV